MRKLLVSMAITVAAVVGMSSTVLALDCSNVSRPAPAASSLPSSPLASFPEGPTVTFNIWLTQANWIWETINDTTTGDALFAAWSFIPPGSLGSDPFAALFPDYNGNFTNGVYNHLLAKASCNPSRQTAHGIQSLCGA